MKSHTSSGNTANYKKIVFFSENDFLRGCLTLKKVDSQKS